MIENILDIGEEMLTGYLKDTDMAAWFFDFKAAFPSISHDYLHAAMKRMGLPGWLCRATKFLYDGTRSEISNGGLRFPGFEQTVGIRQGCPLSPLLFITVLEPLRRRRRQIAAPAACIRA